MFQPRQSSGRGRRARRLAGPLRPAVLAALAGAAGLGLALAAAAAEAPSAAPSAAPRLATPPAGGVAEAPEGHLVVAWEPAGGAPAEDDAPPPGLRYELQTAPLATLDGDFSEARVLDVGPALASLVSGLPDGDTRVRVRAVAGGTPGAWSEPGTIRVDYPELGLVYKLMALGAVTLMALLAAIVTGARRAARRRAEAPEGTS